MMLARLATCSAGLMSQLYQTHHNQPYKRNIYDTTHIARKAYTISQSSSTKSTNNRRRAKTLILTDTPVKNQLEREMDTSQAKEMKRRSKLPAKRPPTKKTLIRNYERESDSESNEEQPILNEISDDDLDDFMDFNDNICRENLKGGVRMFLFDMRRINMCTSASPMLMQRKMILCM